jgi:WD40 repeat protein
VIAVLQGHTAPDSSSAFSPDGTRIVTASQDDTARVWDAATGQQIAQLQGHTAPVDSAAFSPDGTRIVTASGDDTARVWDGESGQLIALLQGHADQVNSAVFSPDGTRIVTASNDYTARVWDVHFATIPTKDLITYVCTHQLLGTSTLTRAEMNLAGYPDTTPLIDACAEVK